MHFLVKVCFEVQFYGLFLSSDVKIVLTDFYSVNSEHILHG